MESAPSKAVEARTPARRWTRKTWAGSAFAALIVLLAFQYVRGRGRPDAWGAAFKISWYDCSQGEICRFHPTGGERGADATGHTYQFRINALGFRGKEMVKERADPSVLRVGVFGSSPVFGLGVDDDETFPVRLEEELRTLLPDRKVEVLNFGLPENFTRSMLTTYRVYGRAYGVDMALFVNAGAGAISPRDMNYRLLQIERSPVLRALLRHGWGRALINELQSRTGAWGDIDTMAEAMRQQLNMLVEDQRDHGLVVSFFSMQGDLDRFRTLVPWELRCNEITSGMSSDEYHRSPLTIPGDGHPTAAGHLHYAQLVAPIVAREIGDLRLPR